MQIINLYLPYQDNMDLLILIQNNLQISLITFIHLYDINMLIISFLKLRYVNSFMLKIHHILVFMVI